MWDCHDRRNELRAARNMVRRCDGFGQFDNSKTCIPPVMVVRGRIERPYARYERVASPLCLQTKKQGGAPLVFMRRPSDALLSLA